MSSPSVLSGSLLSRDLFRGLKFLVVDDCADNQTLMQIFLDKSGASVDLASNGAEAVDMACGQDYDAILMDLQMPIKDGYEATAILRALGYEKPIIAVTADTLIEDRLRSGRAGCSGFLAKPLDRKLLIKTLAAQCQRVIQSITTVR